LALSEIKRAIVTGGGIGGLCTAIAFSQIGVQTTIYEQAESFGLVGAGLTIWANAIKVLRKLGLADAVIETGSKIERGELRNAEGRILSRSQPGGLEQRFGEPTIAIHRADLHQILLSALPAGTLRLGARCTGFEQSEESVTARFSDGQTDAADLLVGTDGIHSVIRQQLFPELALRYSGYTAWRGVVTTLNEVALGRTSETWGCGSRFGIVPIDKNRVYWFATANTPHGKTFTHAGRKAHLMERFKGWHHPIEHLIESTRDEEILHNDIYDLAPHKQWGRGRVILLGDAVHPTTPNMGQGACMAIESSLVLSRCLSRGDDLTTSLRRYQTMRQPRTAWITNQSWTIGRIGQIENPLACKARDFLASITPQALMMRQLEKAAGYET
jgi:2-polyprenyl-6-methoxyphenol hydroxylase-like FAD-dependent oxidoreductase